MPLPGKKMVGDLAATEWIGVLLRTLHLGFSVFFGSRECGPLDYRVALQLGMHQPASVLPGSFPCDLWICSLWVTQQDGKDLKFYLKIFAFNSPFTE